MEFFAKPVTQSTVYLQVCQISITSTATVPEIIYYNYSDFTVQSSPFLSIFYKKQYSELYSSMVNTSHLQEPFLTTLLCARRPWSVLQLDVYQLQ